MLGVRVDEGVGTGGGSWAVLRKPTGHGRISANYTSVFPCASEPLFSSLSLGFLLSVKQNRVPSDCKKDEYSVSMFLGHKVWFEL